MLLIVGFGFVGKAYTQAFGHTQKLGIVDPVYTDNKISDFTEVKGIIICVPTPEAEDGSCDTSYVESVLRECPDVPIMLKSTISLEGWKHIKAEFGHLKIAFSPEFLRADTATEDVLATKHVIISGDNINFWFEVYEKAFPNITASYMSVEEAITVKYFRNSFLATKVAFFNQIYDFCEKLGVDYNVVSAGIIRDDRIGSSHTKVNKNDRGFGGYCFPKDTSALLYTSTIALGVDLSILEAAVLYNNDIRNE